MEMDRFGFYGDTFSNGWGSFYPAKRSYSDNIFQECRECGLLFATFQCFAFLDAIASQQFGYESLSIITYQNPDPIDIRCSLI